MSEAITLRALLEERGITGDEVLDMSIGQPHLTKPINIQASLLCFAGTSLRDLEVTIMVRG